MKNSHFEDYFKFPGGLVPMAGTCVDPDSLGYVYVVGFEEPGVVKIGSARNPGIRLVELQCGNPFELQLLATVSIYEGSPNLIEFAAHRLAQEHRIRGEWFALDAEAALRTVLQAARNQKAKFGAPFAGYDDKDAWKADREAQEEERRRILRRKLGMEEDA